jgi:hypothetical protein
MVAVLAAALAATEVAVARTPITTRGNAATRSLIDADPRDWFAIAVSPLIAVDPEP